MKENVFDVLMYLFENYLYDDEPQPDRDSLESELFEAGFSQAEIRKAFDWLDALADSREMGGRHPYSSHAIRFYTSAETDRLDLECRGLLLYLEQVGVLSPASRELVIDRLMALEEDEVDLETVKWVVLMVLFNQPGEEEAYAWMENFLFDNPAHLLH